MSTNLDDLHAEFDLEKFQAEHTPPSEKESAFITIAMFVVLVLFAFGCIALGWWDPLPEAMKNN